MVRFYSRAAKKKLREGIGKMEKMMSPAARVRREFRLGRPPKSTEHLRPLIAVDKAEMSLADLRNRMRKAETEWFKDEHVRAMLVTVDSTDACLTPVENRDKMLADLTRPGAYALGCVFAQFDADAGKNTFFYVPFIGLTDDERATIQDAAARWRDALEHAAGDNQNN